MKKKEKALWLRELATWLRSLAGAPGVLLVLVYAGNRINQLAGGAPEYFTPMADPGVFAPAAVLAGVLYVAFNAAATRLEIAADDVESEDPRFRLKYKSPRQRGIRRRLSDKSSRHGRDQE